MRQRIRWQWHQGNQGELLVDGKAFFPKMFAAIDEAQSYLLLEFYFVSSGKLLNTLIEHLERARQRGVAVYFLLDAVGSREVIEFDRQQLRRLGVQLHFYNPLRLFNGQHNFRRDHRKLLVVDGHTAFIGGAGLTDEFDQGLHGQQPWHELMVKVSGPVVADWQGLFCRQWLKCQKEQLSLNESESTESGTMPMRIATTQGLRQQGIKVNFRQQLRDAREHVWLVTAYFLPSFSIRRAMMRAARRGVDVAILVPKGDKSDHPGLYYASRRYYRRLLEAGIKIYEYQPRFVHAKLAICDDWVSLGSCNLDHWNLRWNLEANQEIISAEFVAELMQQIEEDCQQSQLITLESWLRRPCYQRLKDYCLGTLNSWLLKIV